MKELIIILLVLCLLMAGYGPESEVDKVYLFNGTKLPELPEFDAEFFAYISAHPLIEGAYALYVSDMEPVYAWDTNTMIPAEGATVQWARCWNDEWSELSDSDADSTLPPIWANFDVKDADGKVYLDASQPVEMWEHAKSFLIGLALGLAGKPLPISQGKEPIAYLYNGVRLPKLPEWDKETYPYAIINSFGTTYFLRAYTDLPIYDGDDNCYFADGSAVQIYCIYSRQMDVWNDWINAGNVEGLSPATKIIWASHNIATDDDILYLAASEPVPVYE